MSTSSKRVNPTNLNKMSHHLEMAHKSMERAYELSRSMSEGRQGRIASTVGDLGTEIGTNMVTVRSWSNSLEGIAQEVKELLS